MCAEVNSNASNQECLGALYREKPRERLLQGRDESKARDLFALRQLIQLHYLEKNYLAVCVGLSLCFNFLTLRNYRFRFWFAYIGYLGVQPIQCNGLIG